MKWKIYLRHSPFPPVSGDTQPWCMQAAECVSQCAFKLENDSTKWANCVYAIVFIECHRRTVCVWGRWHRVCVCVCARSGVSLMASAKCTLLRFRIDKLRLCFVFNLFCWRYTLAQCPLQSDQPTGFLSLSLSHPRTPKHTLSNGIFIEQSSLIKSNRSGIRVIMMNNTNAIGWWMSSDLGRATPCKIDFWFVFKTIVDVARRMLHFIISNLFVYPSVG